MPLCPFDLGYLESTFGQILYNNSQELKFFSYFARRSRSFLFHFRWGRFGVHYFLRYPNAFCVSFVLCQLASRDCLSVTE